MGRVLAGLDRVQGPLPSLITVEGMGDVSVKLASGDMFELKDVKFIPELLKKNLISSSQLDKSSYNKVVFEGGS